MIFDSATFLFFPFVPLRYSCCYIVLTQKWCNLEDCLLRVKGPKLTKQKPNELSRFVGFVWISRKIHSKETDKYWLCARSLALIPQWHTTQTFVHRNMSKANYIYTNETCSLSYFKSYAHNFFQLFFSSFSFRGFCVSGPVYTCFAFIVSMALEFLAK